LLRLRLAMTPIPVIARSKATRQSIFQAVQDLRWIASPSARNDGGVARNDGGWLAMTAPALSLRGAKRRGNPYFRRCRTKDGLLRLRLAMTVGRLAMTVGMARNDHSLLSLRGASRRGNLCFRWCRSQDGLLRLRLAMTVGMARNDHSLLSLRGA